MRTFFSALVVMLLVSGCTTSANLAPPPSTLANVSTISLAPVTFSSHQTLKNERVNIATVLKRDLTDRLERMGYTVVPAGSKTADVRLSIDITYVWDGRLYGDEDLPFEVLYPKLRLYADVTLTAPASGGVLLKAQAQGSGSITPVGSPAPQAYYTAPQKDLARNISRFFPPRH